MNTRAKNKAGSGSGGVRVSPFSNPTKSETAGLGPNPNKLDSVDKCPVCDKTMLPVIANNVPAYYCGVHRICLPQKNV